MKKIEIEIPEGKCAKWVNGVLTLVDNKDITERIKTFEDACNALGDEHPLVTQYRLTAAAYKGDPMTEDFIAYLKLRVICAALNEEWKPTFNKDEHRYYPWLYMYTEENYKKLDEGEKVHCIPLRSHVNANAYGSIVYVDAHSAGSFSSAYYGVQLALKTQELAEYCGRQFVNIWCDYLFS